jgi:hypothetical protein
MGSQKAVGRVFMPPPLSIFASHLAGLMMVTRLAANSAVPVEIVAVVVGVSADRSLVM